MNFILFFFFFGIYLSLEIHDRYLLPIRPIVCQKKLSETRSAWHVNINVLYDCYSHIKTTLFQVAENLEQKNETIATAKGVLNKINNLEITVLLCLDVSRKKQLKLQLLDVSLKSTCEIYSSLEWCIMSKRAIILYEKNLAFFLFIQRLHTYPPKSWCNWLPKMSWLPKKVHGKNKSQSRNSFQWKKYTWDTANASTPPTAINTFYCFLNK